MNRRSRGDGDGGNIIWSARFFWPGWVIFGQLSFSSLLSLILRLPRNTSMLIFFHFTEPPPARKATTRIPLLADDFLGRIPFGRKRRRNVTDALPECVRARLIYSKPGPRTRRKLCSHISCLTEILKLYTGC